MKHWLETIVIIVLSLSIAGCNGGRQSFRIHIQTSELPQPILILQGYVDNDIVEETSIFSDGSYEIRITNSDHSVVEKKSGKLSGELLIKIYSANYDNKEFVQKQNSAIYKYAFVNSYKMHPAPIGEILGYIYTLPKK